MNKKIFVTAVLLFINILSIVKAQDEMHKILKSGTFLKVISREEINTLSADRGDKFAFINLNDMYVFETKVIPESTIFYGEVEDLREPVEGRDAAIKIAINKMITPDNKVYRIKGYIYNDNNNYIGGKQTQSAYYHKIYNHSKGFRPMLQVVPLNVYDKGRHVVILPGQEFFILIEEDILLE